MIECLLMVCSIDPSVQPVLHDLYNKGHAMCYPDCAIVPIKEPLLPVGKSSPLPYV